MTALAISSDLSLPLETVTQTFAIVTKPGASETYTSSEPPGGYARSFPVLSRFPSRVDRVSRGCCPPEWSSRHET
jgi:hypothetical protein